MLPVLCVPHSESLYSNRIQRPLHVSQPAPTDNAQRTGETAQTHWRRTLMLLLNDLLQQYIVSQRSELK